MAATSRRKPSPMSTSGTTCMSMRVTVAPREYARPARPRVYLPSSGYSTKSVSTRGEGGLTSWLGWLHRVAQHPDASDLNLDGISCTDLHSPRRRARQDDVQGL